METKPFVIERTYKASPARVWSAITEKEQMKQWYFDLEEFRPEVGFKFQFSGGPSPDRQYLHLCEVTEVIPERKLTYSWRYDGYNGISYVTFELTAGAGSTTVTLTHTGLESFPNENKDFAASSFAEGWTSLIGASLKNYLEQRKTAN